MIYVRFFKMQKNDKFLNIWRLEILFLSFFGVGMLPKAPGTWATLATMPLLYWMAAVGFPNDLLWPMILLVTIFAIFIAEFVQKAGEIHDPGWIVIDEVIGVTVAWALVPANHWFGFLLIFIFFRIFDIFKIWPCSWIDQNIKHGAGTILDDIFAGFQTAAVVAGIRLFFPQYFFLS